MKPPAFLSRFATAFQQAVNTYYPKEQPFTSVDVQDASLNLDSDESVYWKSSRLIGTPDSWQVVKHVRSNLTGDQQLGCFYPLAKDQIEKAFAVLAQDPAADMAAALKAAKPDSVFTAKSCNVLGSQRGLLGYH